MSETIDALDLLIAACEAEFTSDDTEALDEHGEPDEPDNERVAYPKSHITFGLIRNARIALEAMRDA